MPQLPPDSHAATASQFTSAFAVAVDNAIGAAMSPPAIAAVVTTLRRFFTIFLSPSPRQGTSADADVVPIRARCFLGSRHLGQARRWETDPSRRATVSRRPTNATGLSTPPSGSPTHTQDLGLKLFASVMKTNGRYKSCGGMSRRDTPYIEQITGESREDGVGVFPGRHGES